MSESFAVTQESRRPDVTAQLKRHCHVTSTTDLPTDNVFERVNTLGILSISSAIARKNVARVSRVE